MNRLWKKQNVTLRKCVWAGVFLLSAFVLLALELGPPITLSFLAALVLGFLVFIVCRFISVIGRAVPIPDEPIPHTKGIKLDWAAAIYDWGAEKLGFGLDFRDATLHYAALRPGERVLDVGCGTGELIRLAARYVDPSGRAIGIDPAPRMIEMARRKAVAERSRAEFQIAPVENLPFEDSSFDCVLSSLMTHHLPPDLKIKGLSEIYRVLKPGGRLISVDIDRPANRLWHPFVRLLSLWAFTKNNVTDGLEKYFTGSGFSNVHVAERWMGLVTFRKMYKNQGKESTFHIKHIG